MHPSNHPLWGTSRVELPPILSASKQFPQGSLDALDFAAILLLHHTLARFYSVRRDFGNSHNRPSRRHLYAPLSPIDVFRPSAITATILTAVAGPPSSPVRPTDRK